jgi:hypothetical protein
MQNRTAHAFLGSAFALLFCSVLCARAQNGQAQQQGGQNGQGVPGLRPNVPAHRAPSAPAPVKDINGVWAGTAAPRVNPPPPMTPAGQAAFKANKAFFGPDLVPVAESNDPMIHCDPIGFPRDVLFEIRGIKFVQIPKETLQLNQYQRTWREIWTDGRANPTGVGGDQPNAPDPRYYGYSIGHWDGDYTFVVNTVGMDERTWLDENGHVKSADAKVEERYTRLDHDTLEYTVTVDDPKMYTQPYNAIKFDLQWNSMQEFEEQLCIPTEMDNYMKLIGNPAAAPKK